MGKKILQPLPPKTLPSTRTKFQTWIPFQNQILTMDQVHGFEKDHVAVGMVKRLKLVYMWSKYQGIVGIV
jgi:hypothetical protein